MKQKSLCVHNQTVFEHLRPTCWPPEQKENGFVKKTCTYSVFGSVLGALGSKIKEVMASELAVFNRMVNRDWRPGGIPVAGSFCRGPRAWWRITDLEDRQRRDDPQKL